MTIRYAECRNGNQIVKMDTCPACGAVREWHYYKFSLHLREHHGPEDFGLSPMPESSVDYK